MARRHLVQLVREAVEIDLCAPGAQKYAVILTNRHYDYQRGLADAGIPERLADERVAGPQIVHAFRRQAKAGAAAAVRQDLPVLRDDRQSLVRAQVLADGIEVIAEPGERLRSG